MSNLRKRKNLIARCRQSVDVSSTYCVPQGDREMLALRSGVAMPRREFKDKVASFLRSQVMNCIHSDSALCATSSLEMRSREDNSGLNYKGQAKSWGSVPHSRCLKLKMNPAELYSTEAGSATQFSPHTIDSDPRWTAGVNSARRLPRIPWSRTDSSQPAFTYEMPSPIPEPASATVTGFDNYTAPKSTLLSTPPSTAFRPPGVYEYGSAGSITDYGQSAIFANQLLNTPETARRNAYGMMPSPLAAHYHMSNRNLRPSPQLVDSSARYQEASPTPIRVIRNI